MIKPMPTRIRATKPRKGDGVWDENRFVEGRRNNWDVVNGRIVYVNYREETVLVRFFNGDVSDYSFEDLEGNWTDKLMGFYALEV